MTKRIICVATALMMTVFSWAADTLRVHSFRSVGPLAVVAPVMVDSVNIEGSKFHLAEYALAEDIDLHAVRGAELSEGLPSCGEPSIILASFSATTCDFLKASVEIKGLKHKQLYHNGKKAHGKLNLEPGTHEFIIKYYADSCFSEQPTVSLIAEKEGTLSLQEDGKRIYSLDINSHGPTVSGVSLSPSGKYVIVSVSRTFDGGKTSRQNELVRLSDSRVLVRSSESLRWMPKRDEYYSTVKRGTGERQLLCTNPETGVETVLCANLPEGYFEIAPTEDFLIFTKTQEGPVEGDVHQILTPDDRQPGWRDRSYLSRYDLRTGLMQQLTFGYHSTYLADISDDGTKLLYSVSEERLTQRPTTLTTLYELDLKTLETRKIIDRDGFVGSFAYSPDGRKILVMGSPEAFGGMGLNVPEGKIPNMYDYQLYVVDAVNDSVTPLTKDFAPGVQSMEWSRFDGKIYCVVEDKDCKSIYRIDPVKVKAEKLPAKEEYVKSLSLARSSGVMGYCGQSLCNGDRGYVMDLKKRVSRLMVDASAERLSGVDICQGGGYEFTSTRGDLINCFYTLPQGFDPTKKYPMIVHYYGGCSPSSRYMVGSYSPHYYSAQGYVFLVVNPSGASGFGQEFASRHVNTAGEGVAEDIIEAVESFCATHEFVNREKIGCFSASYGGFMTQLLLIKSEIFAVGISHAGISDHTSYWGEGYWGYSYSEVSMAGSYPWTRKDLYVDRSPLYNADKIHTPLLFLHGSADTNVPIGESIQMFTALKLLGQDTAFVVVDGENHGISEYTKKRQWLRTISAWFARYLKDDSSWWDELYPAKNL